MKIIFLGLEIVKPIRSEAVSQAALLAKLRLNNKIVFTLFYFFIDEISRIFYYFY